MKHVLYLNPAPLGAKPRRALNEQARKAQAMTPKQRAAWAQKMAAAKAAKHGGKPLKNPSDLFGPVPSTPPRPRRAPAAPRAARATTQPKEATMAPKTKQLTGPAPARKALPAPKTTTRRSDGGKSRAARADKQASLQARYSSGDSRVKHVQAHYRNPEPVATVARRKKRKHGGKYLRRNPIGIPHNFVKGQVEPALFMSAGALLVSAAQGGIIDKISDKLPPVARTAKGRFVIRAGLAMAVGMIAAKVTPKHADEIGAGALASVVTGGVADYIRMKAPGVPLGGLLMDDAGNVYSDGLGGIRSAGPAAAIAHVADPTRFAPGPMTYAGQASSYVPARDV